jgi:hypothetical protein
VVQWLLAIAAAAGLVWTVLLAASGTLSRDDTPMVDGIAMPVAILVGALVLGIVLALACRVLVASAAKSRAASADARLRGAVAELTHELVAAPIQGELAAYARFREGLAQALK